MITLRPCFRRRAFTIVEIITVLILMSLALTILYQIFNWADVSRVSGAEAGGRAAGGPAAPGALAHGVESGR